MVELKDFVSESLKQIIDGVVTAQDYAKTKGAAINPEKLLNLAESKLLVRPGQGQYDLIPQLIEFDVAVTASESGGTKAGIGVFAGAFGGSTQATMEDANTMVSRIKFSVPVLFPQQSH
jgi:hypothetical protein